MFTTIESFKKSWKHEFEATEKILSSLTDEVLDRQIADGHWTLGEIAWHIIKTIPEMMSRTGLTTEMPEDYKSTEKSQANIIEVYRKTSKKFIKELGNKWTDDILTKEDDMYGEMWKKGETLLVLIVHQSHHRGQMTVLMRQAGLKVPGVYGPSKDEWGKYGMDAPEV